MAFQDVPAESAAVTQWVHHEQIVHTQRADLILQ